MSAKRELFKANQGYINRPTITRSQKERERA